jgi:hypothetical protein
MAETAVVEDLERGPWLDELVRIWQRDGSLDPDVVAVEARNPASALFPYFTHDPGDALRKLHRIEASRLIRRAEIVLEVEGGEVQRIRAFPFVNADKKYQPAGNVFSRGVMREEVLGRMRSDVDLFVSRYEKYSSIPEVGAAIKQLRRWLKLHGG